MAITGIIMGAMALANVVKGFSDASQKRKEVSRYAELMEIRAAERERQSLKLMGTQKVRLFKSGRNLKGTGALFMKETRKYALEDIQAMSNQVNIIRENAKREARGMIMSGFTNALTIGLQGMFKANAIAPAQSTPAKIGGGI